MGLLFLWTTVLVSVAFLYLFVYVDMSKTGIIPMIKRFFWRTIPESIATSLYLCCGQRGVDAWTDSIDYLFNKPNPVVQILYLSFITVGFAVWVFCGFTKLPGPFASEIHIKTGTALTIACYWTYYKACTVNPGYITKSNLKTALKQFKFDDLMYTPKNECSTCKFVKPARSKHCSLCDMCVEKHDHHCIWINQCVGLHNYKYFLSFLILHAALCCYASVIGVLIFMGIVHENRYFDMTFTDREGNTFPATWGIVLQYLFQTEYYFAGVLVLTFVCTVMLNLFYMYHFYLIMCGETTNESIKRGHIKYGISKAIKILKNWNENGYVPNAQLLQELDMTEDVGKRKIEDRIKQYEQDLKKINTSSFKPPGFFSGIYDIFKY